MAKQQRQDQKRRTPQPKSRAGAGARSNGTSSGTQGRNRAAASATNRNRAGSAAARGGAASPRPTARRRAQTSEPAGLVGRAAGGLRSATSRAAQGARTAGSAAADSVAKHPTAVGAIGMGLAAAGVGLLAARMMLAPPAAGQVDDGSGDDATLFRRAGEALDSVKHRVGDAVDVVRDGTSRLGEYGREGVSKAGAALRGGASAVGAGAEHGYEYTRDKIGGLWDEYPLTMAAGILALGVVAGAMIPTTRAEQAAFGERAAGLTRKAREAGRGLLEKGKAFAGKVAGGAGEAVQNLAEDFDALAPDKVARKAKRFGDRLKGAVADAMD